VFCSLFESMKLLSLKLIGNSIEIFELEWQFLALKYLFLLSFTAGAAS
jgi:hypothetical protein